VGKVGVLVSVCVRVMVELAVAVAVKLGVAVGVLVSLGVAVAVGDAVSVGVVDAVSVAVWLGVAVIVSVVVAVTVGVVDAVADTVAVGVAVSVGETVLVTVSVAVSVGEADGVGLRVGRSVADGDLVGDLVGRAGPSSVTPLSQPAAVNARNKHTARPADEKRVRRMSRGKPSPAEQRHQAVTLNTMGSGLDRRRRIVFSLQARQGNRGAIGCLVTVDDERRDDDDRNVYAEADPRIDEGLLGVGSGRRRLGHDGRKQGTRNHNGDQPPWP